MKNLLIIIMLLGVGYSQCDANGDGDLDVTDIITNVNCILTDCWECDANGDGNLDILDVVLVVSFILNDYSINYPEDSVMQIYLRSNQFYQQHHIQKVSAGSFAVQE